MNQNKQIEHERLGMFFGIVAASVLLACTGCRDRPQDKPVSSSPAADVTPKCPMTAPAKILPTKPTPAATRPAKTQPAATQPASTQPVASMPASTYSSKPPYPVQLYVRSPKDKQPGWLKIVELNDGDRIATASGQFPERNRIYIDTSNVSQIRVHVAHLPMAPRKRLVLQIDGQGMELSRKRVFATLRRRPTGEWVVVKEPKK